MNFTGKTAIVTGGCRGIGYSILHKLAELGVDVGFVDIASIADAQNTIEQVKLLGRKCEFFSADISNLNQAESTVRYFLDIFGHIDILENNAGVNKDFSFLD